MRTLKTMFRRLLRTPGFTAVALVTLAVGIGANTAVFSVLNGVLLKPLPYPDADRLVWLKHQAPGIDVPNLGSAPYLYFIEREQGSAFDGVGLWAKSTVSVTGSGDPEQVDQLLVTADILPMLGAQPLHGRVFTEKDDAPGSPATVMLTHGYWQRHFGGDSTVVGRTLTVDGKPLEIIGVLPRSFRFLDERAAVLQPFQLDRNQTIVNSGYGWYSIARLKRGVTLEQANADVARLVPVAIDAFPMRPGNTREQVLHARIGPALTPLKEQVVGDIGGMLWVLMGSIGLVLLVACANVANLLLVRAESRQQELAIRAALGAGSQRLARELVSESVLLGLLGGGLGVALAAGGLVLLRAMAPANVPRLGDVSLDPVVLLFGLATSVFAGVLFGAIPALKYARLRFGIGLRSGGRALGASRERHRARGALVALQVALALVLLVGAGLMLRTFEALSGVDPGFTRPGEVLAFDVNVPPALVADTDAVPHLQQAILDRLAALPGVASAAFATSAPMAGRDAGDMIVTEGPDGANKTLSGVRRMKNISPGFLATVGTPLIAGRDLAWTDTYEKHAVALVSEKLARAEWGSPAAALGKRLRGSSARDDWREIVGVVGDVRDDGITQPATEIIYLPLLVDRIFNAPGTVVRRGVTFVVRSSRTGAAGFLDEVRGAVWAVNPDLPLADVRTLGDVYERSLARTSLTLVLLALAGGMALLLGVVGIYGVVAYIVSQSAREIGIRIALGAQQRAVTRIFVRRALVLAGLGVALGLGVAAGVSRLMASVLYGVSAVDPLTYVAVCVLLVAAVVLASYVPARRAARVDPLQALRAE